MCRIDQFLNLRWVALQGVMAMKAACPSVMRPVTLHPVGGQLTIIVAAMELLKLKDKQPLCVR